MKKTLCMLLFPVLLGACDAPAEDALDVVERDLSAPFRNTPVLIESLDDHSCMTFDASGYPFRVSCDPSDPKQHFSFEVQTYVGGIGFVYEVCSVVAPSSCLMHTNNGGLFFDEGTATPKFSYEQVRIQHDENDARIEFRFSGKCIENHPNQPGYWVDACDWFGSSPQHYTLTLVEEEDEEEDSGTAEPPKPPKPPEGEPCGAQEQCCEPDLGGGCLLCLPLDAHCP